MKIIAPKIKKKKDQYTLNHTRDSFSMSSHRCSTKRVSYQFTVENETDTSISSDKHSYFDSIAIIVSFSSSVRSSVAFSKEEDLRRAESAERTSRRGSASGRIRGHKNYAVRLLARYKRWAAIDFK